MRQTSDQLINIRNVYGDMDLLRLEIKKLQDQINLLGGDLGILTMIRTETNTALSTTDYGKIMAIKHNLHRLP